MLPATTIQYKYRSPQSGFEGIGGNLKDIKHQRSLDSQNLKMSTLFGSSSATSSQNALGDLSKDVAVVNPPEDSISDISFSTQSQHLAVASWDKKVRIYEINASGGSEGKAYFEHEGPVLSCHWSKVCRASAKLSLMYFTDRSSGWLEGRCGRRRQSRSCDRSWS